MIDQIADGFFRALHLLVPAAFAGAIWGTGFRLAVDSKSIWRTAGNSLIGAAVLALVLSSGSEEPYKIFTTAFLFVTIVLAVGIASGAEAKRKGSPLRELLALTRDET